MLPTPDSFAALPAPHDLGTREFVWRFWLSSLTRVGWRKRIARSVCPRITLQSPFALLSTDFAKLASSLGFQSLALEKLPFVFPQAATSGLLLQLLGNSNFPTSVRAARVKALTITQLRPLDMRFRDQQEGAASPPPDITCVMVLTEKRFLEHEIEFTVQTDLFDDQGTLWQSVMWLAVPFAPDTLLVPLSRSGFQISAALEGQASAAPLTTSVSCSTRALAEFADVALPALGARTLDKTPVLWVLGQVASILQRQDRVPELPLMCNCSFEDDAAAVPVGTSLAVETAVSAEEETVKIARFSVKSGQADVMHGLLRTVGWTFVTPEESGAQ
ncbi:hypothetical protein PybrP1_008299 [[Pythium] brassicae (nom. inval.)]|nr:hypothetical protein PybrP1_008299 [[Pythium] brassicae (nom. inval.)]